VRRQQRRSGLTSHCSRRRPLSRFRRSMKSTEAAGWTASRWGGGKVGRMFADGKYHNYALYTWVEKNARWELVIVRRPEGKKGWVKLPLRWAVERTFAWLGRCRRLSKDRERSVLSSEAFVKLAMIHLMLNRPEPKEASVIVSP